MPNNAWWGIKRRHDERGRRGETTEGNPGNTPTSPNEAGGPSSFQNLTTEVEAGGLSILSKNLAQATGRQIGVSPGKVQAWLETAPCMGSGFTDTTPELSTPLFRQQQQLLSYSCWKKAWHPWNLSCLESPLVSTALKMRREAEPTTISTTNSNVGLTILGTVNIVPHLIL